MERLPLTEECADHSVLWDHVMGSPVDDKKMDQQLGSLHWNRNDFFRVMVFAFRLDQYQKDTLSMAAELLGRSLNRGAVFVSGPLIVGILNETITPKSRSVLLINTILQQTGLQMGESFCAGGIQAIPHLYRQALTSLNLGQRFEPEKDSYHFYQYAIDHILGETGGDGYAPAYVCHPDVIRLWLADKRSNGFRIKTLWAYLNNDRSLINTAQELFIHRSTLVYRITKITAELSCDITDPYTRDYIKISIRMLRLYPDQMLDAGEMFL